MTAAESNPALRAAVQQAMAKAPRCDAECLAPIRSFPILEVVKEMQTELTANEPKTIPLALQVLAFAAIERADGPSSSSDAAASATESLLPNAHALEVLFAFLVTKINHFSTIDSAVDAVSRVFVWYAAHHPQLLTRPSREAGTTAILKSVVNNMLCKISVPSMFGNSKTSAFALLKALLTPAIVENLSREEASSFLEAFLVSVDGERDPTFVLDVFTMAYSILTSFSAGTLENYSEDYFMTLSNYFPVLFNPPPRCTVTKEELKTALTRVLVLPVFSEVCIPFVLSKLSSPAEVAKVDSLGLLHDIFSRAAAVGAKVSDDVEPAYTPALLDSHMADVLGALRGEALKLAASVAFNPSAKDLLRQVMGAAEDVGRVLDVIGAKEGREAILSHCDRTLGACLGTIDAGSDARAYAMLLNALCKGGATTASVLSSYVLPMVGLKLLGLDVAQPSSSSSSGADEAGGDGKKKLSTKAAEQEERIYMSAVAVIGGVFSALESRKNGNNGAEAMAPIAVKPQTTACIVAALMAPLSSAAAPHPYLEDTLPLVVEVVATFVAIRGLLPGGAEGTAATDPFACPSSVAICRLMLRRACAAHTDADAANVAMKALGNVARVASATVLEATIGSTATADAAESDNATASSAVSGYGSGSLVYELAASPRLPSFFAQLHAAVGASVSAAALDALILSSSSGKAKSVIAAAIDIFGFSNAAIDALLHAVALFTASAAAAEVADEASSASPSPVISAVIAALLGLGIPERCAAGADLLCQLLAQCPAAQSALLAEASPAAKGSMVSWLCAVASADKAAIAAHYVPLAADPSANVGASSAAWVPLCLSVLINGSGATQQVRALALRAIASIANKGAEGVVSAAVFEEAMAPIVANGSLSAGDVASVRSAVCKGLLARGGGGSNASSAVEILAPLLSALAEQQGGDGVASPFAAVPIGAPQASSSSTAAAPSAAALLVSAFGQLVTPPFPTGGGSMWVQRAYVALTGALLAASTGAATPSPLALVAVAELIRCAPLKVVAATSLELVQQLAKVLEIANVRRTTTAVAAAPNAVAGGAAGAVISTPSVAAVLCLAQMLSRADGMPVDALRAAVATILTFGEASKGLYNAAYVIPERGAAKPKGACPHSSPAVPMAVRDLLVSALLAAFAVVEAGLPDDGASAGAMGTANKVGGKGAAKAEDPLRPLAREAKAMWVVPWLRAALDDPKRQIRSLAAKASHEWHKVK